MRICSEKSKEKLKKIVHKALLQKSIKSWSSSESLESEESDSSSSSAGNVDVVWAVGAGVDVSLRFGVA